MPTKATTVEEYIEQLPVERKEAIAKFRKTIVKNIPKGFSECIGYGMIGYVVPHTLYPAGYHATPKLPLPFMNLGSQKNYISFHHLGLYQGVLLDWFLAEWPKYSKKKLDMGKGCVRFKKAEDIPLDLIAELCTKLTAQQWIEIYEKTLKR